MIDPIELRKIRSICVRNTMRKYSTIPLTRDDLIAEAEYISFVCLKNYDETKATLGRYIYSNIMDHLRKYINRKIVKHTYGIKGNRRIGKDIGDLVYKTPSVPSYLEQVEARDTIALLRSRLKGDSLKILNWMEEGLSGAKIAEMLGVSKMYITRRMVKMRKIITDETA